VKTAGRQLLAHTGLPLQEHGDLRSCRELQDREELAHRQAFGDELSKTTGLTRRDLEGLRQGLHPKS
jgi:hypothetical protein